MATMRDVAQQPQGGAGSPQAMLDQIQDTDLLNFDEALFDRIVDRQRVALFGGESAEGDLSPETQRLLDDPNGQAGPAGQVVNAAAEANTAVLIGAEQAGVEVPPAEGIAAGIVAMMDVADAVSEMGRPLSPEEGVQAMYATVDNVVRRGVNQGVWDEDEAAEVMEALMQSPGEFEQEMRSLDPEGAEVMQGPGDEPMPEEAPQEAAGPSVAAVQGGAA